MRSLRRPVKTYGRAWQSSRKPIQGGETKDTLETFTKKTTVDKRKASERQMHSGQDLSKLEIRRRYIRNRYELFLLRKCLDATVTLFCNSNGEGEVWWTMKIDHCSDAGFSSTISMMFEAPFDINDLPRKLLMAEHKAKLEKTNV